MGAIYTWGPFIRTSWDSIPIKTRHIVCLRSWGPFMRTWFRFWVSAGCIIQCWNHFHIFCTLCFRFTALFRSCVLAFGPLSDHRYDVQVRFVLSGDCMFEHPMQAFMEWMRGRKSHKTYGGRSAILFGGDHLGGAPESLARTILVSLGPSRGET